VHQKTKFFILFGGVGRNESDRLGDASAHSRKHSLSRGSENLCFKQDSFAKAPSLEPKSETSDTEAEASRARRKLASEQLEVAENAVEETEKLISSAEVHRSALVLLEQAKGT